MYCIGNFSRGRRVNGGAVNEQLLQVVLGLREGRVQDAVEHVFHVPRFGEDGNDGFLLAYQYSSKQEASGR